MLRAGVNKSVITNVISRFTVSFVDFTSLCSNWNFLSHVFRNANGKTKFAKFNDHRNKFTSMFHLTNRHGSEYEIKIRNCCLPTVQH